MKKSLRANTVRRVFAMLLAFSLCAGNLLLPAAAEETDGNVVVVTETVTTSGGVTHTETTTTESWSDSETKGGATGNTGNTATPTTVTKNEGTETTVDVTDTKGSKPVAASQEVSGENTTTITQETKTDHTETTTEPAEDSFEYTPKETTETTTPTETIKSTESTESVSLDRPTKPNVTLEMTQQNNKDSEKISAAGTAATQKNLNGITKETTTVTGNQTDKDGQTTVTKTPIKLEDGTVIGYQVVTTNVKVTEEVVTSEAVADTQNKSESSETGDSVTESTTTKTTYRMPEEPKGGVTKNSDGTTVTTTVEKLMEGGVHVGYKTTAVTTDAKGKELNRSSENIYRTEITTRSQTASVTTTKTTTTPLTNERTTTTVTTTIVDTQGRRLVPLTNDPGNWYWVYSAELGSVEADTGNGAINMDSLTPTQKEPAEKTVNTTTDLYHRPNGTPNNVALEGWPLIWKGEYGLESAIRVLAKNHEGETVTTYQPHQFILRDGNNEAFYVYCADFEVNPYNGYRYDVDNLEDATYYDDAAAKHIRYIALNGYWGTTGTKGSDTYRGSLDYVQDLMRNAKDAAGNPIFTADDISNLTPGEALTATQAAIWYFGNSSKNPACGINKDNGVVGLYYKGGDSWRDATNGEKNRVNKLFNFFISQTAEAAPGTTVINENNFATEAKLTIKEKVANATNLNEGAAQTQQPDTYKTDLSFSLLMEPTEDDELYVTVLDSNGKILRNQIPLGGNSSASNLPNWLYRDSNQMYTIRGLEIAEGVTVTLNLSGTQNLEPGVYLYTSEVFPEKKEGEGRSSQTFVGVANGTREVNLNVNLKFEVQDPQLAVKSNTKQETATKKNTKVETGTGTRTEVTESKHITVTETVTESTRSTWYSTWSRRFSSNNGGGGDDGNGGGGNTGGRRRGTGELLSLKKNELVIPDEEVPLAKVPVTGDNSAIWFALGVLSLAGMVLLNSKRKKAQYF